MNGSTSDFTGTDRFKIRRRLGSGGMGVVYEAHDRETDKVLALKALTRTEAADIFRFKREFRALADVSHPNLVSLYEFMSDGQFWFFTMELVRGVTFIEYVRPGFRARRNQNSGIPTLVKPNDDSEDAADHEAETIELDLESVPTGSATGTNALQLSSAGASSARIDHSKLDLPRLRSALRQLAEGLHGLHETGKLHRDIKPSNILVTRDGRVVILDFGLVAEVGGRGDHDSMSFAGTPDFMSPEQGAQLPVNKSSDWYSVGVMLYQALTGKLPFKGRYFEVIMNKQSLDPPAPVTLVPDTPADLNDLCVRLLRRKPDDRPGGREVLRLLGHGKTGPLTPPLAVRPDPTSHLPQPFIGRARQLEELAHAFDTTRQGHTVTVYIHGSSGMGKTALVRHFVDQLGDRQENAVILEGRCYERESVPYKALDGVVDSLNQYLRSLPDAKAGEIVPREAYALARLFPVLLQVDSIFNSPQREEIPDPLLLRRRAFAALRDLLARISEQRPLVLWIDDLQWADADSTALLEDLLRPPNAPPLLLLASFRTEDIEAKPFLRSLIEQAGTMNQRELRLGELPPNEARDIARALLGPGVPVDSLIIESIVKEARGNPFLLEQLGRYAATTDHEATSGITLSVMLEARMRHLPIGARRLMATLAVAGRPINPEVAYQAAGLTGDELPLISSLRSAQFLRSGGSKFGVELYHDRIREALMARLERVKVKQIHRRLAQTLEARGIDDPESLFEHYLGADERVRAATHAAAAARKADAALAFDRAAIFYRRALELSPTRGADLAELKIGVAEALVNAGRPAEAAEAFLEVAKDTSVSRHLDFKRRAAEQLLMGGHMKEGLEVLNSVLAAAGFKLATGPKRALLSLLWRRGYNRLRGLNFVERDASQIPEMDLFRIDLCAAVVAGLGTVDLIRAADFQCRHLLLALKAGEPYRVSRAMAFEAAQAAVPGRKARRRAQGIAQRAEALASKVGHQHAVALSLWASGVGAYCVGHWKRSAELCERAAEILRERCTGVTWELSIAHRFLLGSFLLLGELAEIKRRVPALLGAALEQGNFFVATDLRTRMNVIWLAADDPDRARAEVIEALKVWPREGFHLQHYCSMHALAQIELYTGDAEVAWKHVEGQWEELNNSMLLRLQIVRVEALHLQARTALATAIVSNPQKHARLYRIAAKIAQRITREKMPWSDPFAALIRAAIATGGNQHEQAIALLSEAMTGFELADQSLYAAASRRRLGQMLGGERGAELIAAADKWMRNQEIKNPALMTRMLAPGWNDE
ncbi:MAG: AAA family ATPase [Acidobacteriota bacterium]|nr:AAA family ATPase [Acidobacteriota bacterium]